MSEVPPDAAPPLVLRPSLLAALDTLAKILLGLLPFVIPLLISGALVGGDQADATPLVVLLLQNGGVVFGIFAAFGPAIQLAFTRYELDDDGVVVRYQILSRQEQRVSWEKVTAIGHRITLVDRMLGIQRVDIIAYGARGATLHLVGLRDAAAITSRAAVQMRRHADLGALLRND